MLVKISDEIICGLDDVIYVLVIIDFFIVFWFEVKYVVIYG